MIGDLVRINRRASQLRQYFHAPDLVLVQAWLVDLFPQYVPVKEPGQIRADLVFHKCALGDGEDPVKILKGAALGLFDENEHEEEGYEVEPGEEAQCTTVAKLVDDAAAC